MGLFTGGEKYYRLAEGVKAKAYGLQKEQKYAQFGRELLQDIRQARIARAQIAQENFSDDFSVSSAAGAASTITSNLAGAYGYAIDTSNRAQQLQTLNMYMDRLYKKGEQRDRRSATAAKITAGSMRVAGSFFGPVGEAVGSIAGSATVRAMGGGKAARRAADEEAVKGLFSSASEIASSYAKANGYKNPFSDKVDIEESGGISYSGGAYKRNGRRLVVTDRAYGYARIPGVFD